MYTKQYLESEDSDGMGARTSFCSDWIFMPSTVFAVPNASAHFLICSFAYAVAVDKRAFKMHVKSISIPLSCMAILKENMQMSYRLVL